MLAIVIGLVIVGLLCGSLLIDRFGWFGLETIPFTWKTLVGIILIVGGVLLFQLSGEKETVHQPVKEIV